MKQTWLADIEVFPNFFFIGVEDYRTGEVHKFEVSEYLDDRERIFNTFSKFSGYFVTFNGIHYDNVVISYILKDYHRGLKDLDVSDFLISLKEFSNKVIESDNNHDEIKYYKWYKKRWTDIDLFLYWSKELRISKKISLKSLGIQLGHPEVQELPYEHTRMLNLEEINNVKHYNLVNDLGILKRLFDEKKPDIGLRAYVNKEYGLPCYSTDTPKIASEILLKDYCTSTGLDPKDVRKRKFEAYTGKIGDLFDNSLFEFKHPQLKQVYKEILQCDRNFSKEFAFIHGKTAMIVSLGIGGIHTLFSNKVFEVKEGKSYISSDVASLYPTNIINYAICRYNEVFARYVAIKEDRLEAKKLKLKQKDTFLKLILNGFSGLIDQEYSWLYYSEGALKLRIIGQLIMLKALEECALKGYEVLALNTDSIDVIINKHEEEEYYSIIESLQKKYTVVFEHEHIKKTVYSHINSYIQISQAGKVKRKGAFKLDFDELGNREIPLGDACNELVIPKALNLYFVSGIPVEESISNPEKYGFHIYDYCKSNKVSKDYAVIHNGEKVQNLNRYYFSQKGPYLFKKKKSKTTLEHINVGEGVLLFNKFEEKKWSDYEINYSHYISKAREIINGVESKQLTLFE